MVTTAYRDWQGFPSDVPNLADLDTWYADHNYSDRLVEARVTTLETAYRLDGTDTSLTSTTTPGHTLASQSLVPGTYHLAYSHHYDYNVGATVYLYATLAIRDGAGTALVANKDTLGQVPGGTHYASSALMCELVVTSTETAVVTCYVSVGTGTVNTRHGNFLIRRVA